MFFCFLSLIQNGFKKKKVASPRLPRLTSPKNGVTLRVGIGGKLLNDVYVADPSSAMGSDTNWCQARNEPTMGAVPTKAELIDYVNVSASQLNSAFAEKDSSLYLMTGMKIDIAKNRLELIPITFIGQNLRLPTGCPLSLGKF